MLLITGIYCPPRRATSAEEDIAFFQSLGSKFLIGGDWNTKYKDWGARLSTPKERNPLHAINRHNYKYLITGESTYWPSEPNTLPDLLDFFILHAS
jgi:hypothetical protein